MVVVLGVLMAVTTASQTVDSLDYQMVECWVALLGLLKAAWKVVLLVDSTAEKTEQLTAA